MPPTSLELSVNPRIHPADKDGKEKEKDGFFIDHLTSFYSFAINELRLKFRTLK